MSLDIPHMIVTVAICFAVLWGLEQTPLFANMPKRKATVLKLVTLFVAILILNIVWPYGSNG